MIRYEELYAIDPNQARATPKEHHDEIVEYLVANVQELEKFKFIKEIRHVFMIRMEIKLWQLKVYTNDYLEME